MTIPSLPEVKIIINGEEITSDEPNIIQIQVRYATQEIPEALISLYYDVKNKPEFAICSNITIKVDDKTVFSGLLTGRELTRPSGKETKPIVDLTCYGELVKTVGKHHYQVFANKKNDADVIIKLLDDVDVKHNLKSGSMLEFDSANHLIMIYNSSIWEYIKQRAKANGRLILPTINGEEEKLKFFKEGDEGESNILDLSDNKSIIEYKFKKSCLNQSDSIQNKTWDRKKQQFKGQKKSSKSQDTLPGIDNYINYLQAPLLEAEANERASAEIFYRKLDLYKGSIVLRGEEKNVYSLGDTIQIKNSSFSSLNSFQGNEALIITGITHDFNSIDYWKITYSLGLCADKILGCDDSVQMVHGLQIGQVKDYNDFKGQRPSDQNLIPVKLAKDKDNNDLIVLAILSSPFASAEKGLFLPPQKDDEVILGFLGNDIRYPVILGSLYNEKRNKEFPPKLDKLDKDKNKYSLLLEKDKLFIEFDDEKKVLVSKAGEKNTLTIEKDKGFELNKEDKHIVTIEDFIKLESDGNHISINKPSSNIKIKAKDRVEVNK
ncbi:phage baseplate assembly protein V [Spartinivicinus poritis]|uniref:Phage baseplate assembly protein V n=1 Tax=Spartinivicinus poritis TaxID=2994640 RepID=A0ABT5UHQ0_9GAMM|nr:phage baseplate assembly protein V [Spartinivicinus sp. A2-2]MDE1465027.1 phage baseplate assembly protein V [Spartinivicinus sp. A2-2]